jgi:hypothetical protein
LSTVNTLLNKSRYSPLFADKLKRDALLPFTVNSASTRVVFQNGISFCFGNPNTEMPSRLMPALNQGKTMIATFLPSKLSAGGNGSCSAIPSTSFKDLTSARNGG